MGWTKQPKITRSQRIKEHLMEVDESRVSFKNLPFKKHKDIGKSGNPSYIIAITVLSMFVALAVILPVVYINRSQNVIFPLQHSYVLDERRSSNSIGHMPIKLCNNLV